MISVIAELTRATRRRTTVNPRTILAFYATMGISIATLSVAAVGVLATSDTSTFLIPWILVIGLCSAVFILIAVLYLSLRKPQSLMLGQITGAEYAEIERVAILGNSASGERVVSVLNDAKNAALDQAEKRMALESDSSVPRRRDQEAGLEQEGESR